MDEIVGGVLLIWECCGCCREPRGRGHQARSLLTFHCVPTHCVHSVTRHTAPLASCDLVKLMLALPSYEEASSKQLHLLLLLDEAQASLVRAVRQTGGAESQADPPRRLQVSRTHAQVDRVAEAAQPQRT